MAAAMSSVFKANTGLIRGISSNNGQVRVRFAPSPTGFLHLGGLRTALYNYLFAKSQGGVFLLRIEDTDQSRVVENATENLINDLNWCGIKHDEVAEFQSQRLELYKKCAEQLLDQGDAYHCFCTNVRLNLLRREALKQGQISKYDNKCRLLSKKEVESRLSSGQPSCVRFKLTSLKEVIVDLVQGDYQFDVAALEGDPIIVKSDGFPTYHLANVVDDHLMKITHVLRGVEWQVSTPKHLLLYRAFGWMPPAFGHLPLLLNEDGSKISKRLGHTQIRHLRQNGYTPNAVLNFVTSFGGGFHIHLTEKNCNIISLEELISKFDLKKIKSSSCKVNFDKLKEFNKLEIKSLLETSEGEAAFVKEAKKFIMDHFKNSEAGLSLELDDDYVRTILTNIRHRISNLRDLVSKEFVCLWSWKNVWREEDKNIRESVKNLTLRMSEWQCDWSKNNITLLLNEFTQNKNLNKPAFFKSLRLLLIGLQEGPSVVEIMYILGKEKVHRRMAAALTETQEQGTNCNKV